MARIRIQPVIDWLKRVVTEPRGELNRWQAAVRYCHDLSRYGARQLKQDRAPQMAAALSFRALFGLLPVIVVGTLLVKALGGFERFRESLGEFLGSLGLDEMEISTKGGEEAVVAGGTSLSDWLLDIVAQAETINLAAITWVGVAVLVYSAISLMVTIEGCFNTIYRAPEGRSWLRRAPIYWTVLSLGPAALGLSMYVDSRFDTFLTQTVSWHWVLYVAPILWSFTAAWLVMFLFYKLMPNTNVRVRPALAGAFVAAILLEIGKRTMGAYLENALSIRQLYGSLGLIPLFMFWVYLMWLVVLFGLEVSATLQMLAGRRLDELEQRQQKPTGLADPASILSVMEVIGERFSAAQPATARELAEATGVAEATVQMMLGRLIEAGVLHRLDRDDGAVTLARPPDRITADELIELGYALVEGGGVDRKSPLMQKLRESQRALAAQSTLAGLLVGPAPAAGTDKVSPS